jgi:hypothetical protein
MATYNVTRAKHATLTASTVDQVNLAGYPEVIRVTNRGSSDIYYRFDGTDPTVAGDDCYLVRAGGSVVVGKRAASNASVELISAGAPDYSVEGF